MFHSGRVGKSDLNAWLEIDVQQLQQLDFVLHTFGIQAHDFFCDALGGPGLHRDGAKAAPARDEALDVHRSRFAMRGEKVRQQRHAARRRESSVGR